MDQQKIWFGDKRVVHAVRGGGLLFSVLLAALCLLIHYGVVDVPASYSWAAWPLAIDLVVLGLVLRFWNPFTSTSFALFLNVYAGLAAIVGILLTGFNTLTFLGWLVLIIIIDMFFGRRRALFGYCLMVASLVTWVLLRSDYQTLDQLLTLLIDVVAVSLVAALVSTVLHLTTSAVNKLEVSQSHEDLEHTRLTSLVNAMADGVIAVDKNASVLLYNAAALNVLDINSSMQSKPIAKFMQLLDGTMKPVDVTDLITTTKVSSISRDYRLHYGDGSIVNLYLAITPVNLGYGKGGIQGFVLILRDITREKSLEEERDEFISVVSHELRTPIAISEGNISNAQFIAEHNPKPADLKKALDEAHNQVLFLADMINDLATLSRAERGKLTLDLEDIALQPFAEELADNYRTDADAKNLELSVIIPSDLKQLRSSKLYVREILQNFITNAIKYTDSGSVTLTAKAKDDGILFSVSDTGIGISKADQEKVFDKFFRSEDYRTRQHNGTGLGLYVTMKLARLVHAEINLKSELNNGTTFMIYVPNIHSAPEANEAPADAVSHA